MISIIKGIDQLIDAIIGFAVAIETNANSSTRNETEKCGLSEERTKMAFLFTARTNANVQTDAPQDFGHATEK